ncbi:hypothetical protein CDEST_07072 [Colletotrichum destructivum]|uniref:IBR domain-containing protein n=1 Tax=Colletotrichum destructivum TaxID=34406 RepID=A0AAX4IGW3_9PEZI|nr:hypothetical protein CDEST_07072 [Colletotrichum destructivum]
MTALPPLRSWDLSRGWGLVSLAPIIMSPNAAFQMPVNCQFRMPGASIGVDNVFQAVAVEEGPVFRSNSYPGSQSGMAVIHHRNLGMWPNCPSAAKGPFQWGPKRHQTPIWQCCYCGQAGMPIRTDPCRNCGTPRCAYCPVTKIRVRAHDQVFKAGLETIEEGVDNLEDGVRYQVAVLESQNLAAMNRG